MSEPFVPFQYFPLSPRGQIASSQQGSASAPAAMQVANPLIPYAREIDLSTMGAVTTTVYTKDFFLLHPIECSFQRILVSAAQQVVQDSFGMQVVQRQGNEIVDLTDVQYLQTLPVTVPVVVEGSTNWGDGPVFLRITTKPQDYFLFVTIETLANEVV